MADKNVGLEASDVFALGGLFIAQSSSVSTTLQHAKMKKANGDFEKFSDTFNHQDDVTATYKFNADSGLGAALPKVGEVKNGYAITEISISTTWEDYPEISITGHAHDANTHETGLNEYAISAEIIALLTGAIGAYDFAGLAGDDVCTTGSTYTLGVNHIDVNCGAGDHWVGNQIEGMESISVDYVGFIASYFIADWTVTGFNQDDSNDAFDISAISAEKLVLRDAS